MLSEVDTDVLIVGLGPVGASAANLLGGYGVKTLVVDRAEEVMMAPRAIALDHEALRILQWVGLPRGAFATVEIPAVRMVDSLLGEFARFETAGTIDCHPKLITFYQPELEHALIARLAANPNVTMERGVSLVALEEEGARVSATLCDREGVQRTVRARYVIGADGASSTVRKLLALEFPGVTYAQDWLVVDVINSPSPISDVEFFCDPERPAPHMAAPGKRQRWEFMLHAGESRAEMDTDEAARKLLARWGSVSDDVVIERRAIYRFHARVCERFQKGRVFLVGDAAHVTPPFVGQGLVAGLRDVANLCWKLSWVLRHGARPQILASYDEERRPHAARMIELARAMGILLMPPDKLSAFAIHGAVRAVRTLKLARSYLDGMRIKPRLRYGRGLFVPGSRGQGALYRGGWFPQLALSQGNATRLSDDVLGCHLVCVGLGVDPESRLDPESRSAFLRMGGRFVQLGARSGVLPARDGVYALPPDSELATHASRGWIAIVRPDRTLLHDGPAHQSATIMRQSLELLGARVDNMSARLEAL